MNNQSINPEQDLEQPVAPLPQKINPLFIINGLFIIAIILTGGIFIGRYLNSSQNIPAKEITPTPSVAPSSSPSPTITSITDPTANWKTYTFQPLQLSLKVPYELTVHTNEPNTGSDFTAYIQNYAFNAPFPQENAYQLYIVWQKTPSVTQIEFERLKDDLDSNSVTNTVIANYPAIKGQIKGERNRFVTYILKGNTKISLFTSEATQINKVRTDQILSTFKFTDQTIDTSDWKTYENKEYGYSFQYPPVSKYSHLSIREYQVDGHTRVDLETLDDDEIFPVITVKQDQCKSDSILVEDGQQLLKLMTGIKNLIIKTKNGNCMNIFKEIYEPLDMLKRTNDKLNQILSTFKFTSGLTPTPIFINDGYPCKGGSLVSSSDKCSPPE